MVATTDVVIQPETIAEQATATWKTDKDGDQTMASSSTSAIPEFKPLSGAELAASSGDGYRKVLVPSHRVTPLKEHWMKIYTPLVEHMQLQIRYSPRSKCVEMRTSPTTPEAAYVQKAADFLRAFMLGFDVDDAMALLRLDDLFVESFDIKDVKTLHGDHLARAIGRIAGKGGKTRFTIENASRTRIVVADTRIHIMGSFQNIKIARDAVCALIMGSPPGKVYANLRTVATRMRERF